MGKNNIVTVIGSINYDIIMKQRQLLKKEKTNTVEVLLLAQAVKVQIKQSSVY